MLIYQYVLLYGQPLSLHRGNLIRFSELMISILSYYVGIFWSIASFFYLHVSCSISQISWYTHISWFLIPPGAGAQCWLAKSCSSPTCFNRLTFAWLGKFLYNKFVGSCEIIYTSLLLLRLLEDQQSSAHFFLLFYNMIKSVFPFIKIKLHWQNCQIQCYMWMDQFEH